MEETLQSKRYETVHVYDEILQWYEGVRPVFDQVFGFITRVKKREKTLCFNVPVN